MGFGEWQVRLDPVGVVSRKKERQNIQGLATIAKHVKLKKSQPAIPTGNVNLTKQFDDFITKRIASGESSNASEVVREALRLLEERQLEHAAKLAWLRGAINESINDFETGDLTSIDSEQELEAFFDSIHEEVLAEAPFESKIA